MKERIINLLKVKSIVTIILTFVFAFLSITGAITANEFLTIFTVVIGFYFGVQKGKEK